MPKDSKAAGAGKWQRREPLSHPQKNVLEFGLFVVELLSKAVRQEEKQYQRWL
jgi:hypothetical protein